VNSRFYIVIALAVSFILAGCAEKWTFQLKVPRMTKEELKSLLGNPDVIILDVRESGDWKESKWKIPGAVREDSEKDLNTWADRYPKDKTLVFYCARPNEETSAWTAREFISRSFKKAFALKGGWNGWFKANYPIETK